MKGGGYVAESSSADRLDVRPGPAGTQRFRIWGVKQDARKDAGVAVDGPFPVEYEAAAHACFLAGLSTVCTHG
jgi:hypothetical protein